MKKNYLPHLALLLTNVIYGLNYNVAKWLLTEFLQPFAFIFCRVLFAGILFWLFSTFRKQRKIDPKDFPRMILCGLFGVAMNQLMFFHGLNLTSPVNASVIMVVTPVLVLVFAALIIHEKITLRKISGILMGISGALLLILMGSNASSISSASGDMFIFLNAASYAIYLVIAKPLLQKYDAIQVNKWTFLFGLVFVIPFGFVQFTEINWQAFTGNVWAAFAFVILGTSFIAYLFNAYGLKRLNASTVSIYIYLQPLTATTLAVTMGYGNLDMLKILSAILIFAGVFLVSSPKIKAQSN